MMKFIIYLHLSFLPLLLFFLFLLEIDGQDQNMVKEYCPEQHCGNIPVRYPFYRTDTASSARYCGYPGFGVTCPADPMFFLNSYGYKVKNISYPEKIITLVDPYVIDNSTCPRLRRNLTIENLPLENSRQNVNLAFYYNCSSSFVHGTVIDCLSVGEYRSYVIEGDELENVDWYGSCQEKVLTTVIGRDRNDEWLSTDNFGRTMHQGFELQWSSSTNCHRCEESKGQCGSNDSRNFLCFCNDGTVGATDCRKGGTKNKISLIVGPTAAFSVLILIAILYFRVYNLLVGRPTKIPYRNENKVNAIIKQFGSISPKRYCYSDIIDMTNSFADKLGKGGFGTVYKGMLKDGRLVAVKVLNRTAENGEDFINEVASISRTSHVNIITLLGFCYDGKRRALIFEFMPNGSLDKYLSESECCLDWKTLFKISTSSARGLEYLHRGCNTRIVHFDIKPHNILLDENFDPKISDFGLAKLKEAKESIFSKCSARGTIGYIAPEVFFRNFGGVSHKSDVYSYGMMILEMVGVRTNSGVQVERSSQNYFPQWIYDHLEFRSNLNIQVAQGEEEEEMVRKLIMVGLWCIQTNPSDRPSMSKVVEMLEGGLESLQMPPKPFLHSPPNSYPSQESSPKSIKQSSTSFK